MRTKLADEKKTINNADETMNRELYDIADDLVSKDRIDRLREKSRGISQRNTGGRDTNGMMNTLIEIVGNQQARKATRGKAVVKDREAGREVKDLISQAIGLSGDFGQGDTKRINRYNDYRVIDEYIPELSTSVDVLRDSILSPDDFTKRTAYYVYDDGDADASLNKADKSVFEEKMNALQEKFKLDQFIKDSARDALVLGDDFTIVRPIKEEFLNFLTEHAEVSDLDYLLEDSGELITEDIYQDTLMEDLSAFLTEASTDLVYTKEDSTPEKDPTELIRGVVKSVKDNLLVVNRPELLLSDRKRAYKELSTVRGAYFKHVRPDDMIKLELDHVCIGYLYFDRSVDQATSNILGRDTSNTSLLQAMTSALNSDSESSSSSSSTTTTVGSMSFNHTDGGKLAVEGNTAKAYDALVRLFSRGISEKINKRFLEDNKEFREVILSLLKNDYLVTKKVAVTFLDPDDVVHNKPDSSETYGKSVYKNGLFFAKLYLINTLNTMMIKINQGRDKRVYYVENGLDDDFEGTIESLIRDLRSKEIPTSALGNENSISTVMRQVGSLEAYYIPVNNGERPFDIDMIPGMQVDVDESDLDRLLRSAQRSTGVPYNFIDASTDVDFSRTIAIQNQGFVKNILIYQGTFGEYYTNIVQKLWRCEYEDDLATIKPATKDNQKSPKAQSLDRTDNIYSEYIKVSFPPPITLNATTISEQISATEQVIEYLTTLYYGDEDDTNRESRRIFKKNLAKDVYFRNIDWNMITQVKLTTDKEATKESIKPEAENAEGGEGTSFNY